MSADGSFTVSDITKVGYGYMLGFEYFDRKGDAVKRVRELQNNLDAKVIQYEPCDDYDLLVRITNNGYIGGIKF